MDIHDESVNADMKQDVCDNAMFVSAFHSKMVFQVTGKNFHLEMNYYDVHSKVNFNGIHITNDLEKGKNYAKLLKTNGDNLHDNNQINIRTEITLKQIVITLHRNSCNCTNVNMLTTAANSE